MSELWSMYHKTITAHLSVEIHRSFQEKYLTISHMWLNGFHNASQKPKTKVCFNFEATHIHKYLNQNGIPMNSFSRENS